LISQIFVVLGKLKFQVQFGTIIDTISMPTYEVFIFQ